MRGVVGFTGMENTKHLDFRLSIGLQRSITAFFALICFGQIEDSMSLLCLEMPIVSGQIDDSMSLSLS